MANLFTRGPETHDVELGLLIVPGVDGHRDSQVVVEVRLALELEPDREPPAKDKTRYDKKKTRQDNKRYDQKREGKIKHEIQKKQIGKWETRQGTIS